MVVPASCSLTLQDLTSECGRIAWATLLPATLVVVLALCAVRYPRRLTTTFHSLSNPWSVFLYRSEAEAYELDGATLGETKPADRAPLRFTLLLVVLASLEAIAWTVIAAFTFATGGMGTTWYGVCASVVAVTWVYAAIKPILKLKGTPSYDLFALYVLHLLGGTVLLGGALYEHSVYFKPLPPPAVLALYMLNLAIVLSLLLAVFSRPVAMPSYTINNEEIVSYHQCSIASLS